MIKLKYSDLNNVDLVNSFKSMQAQPMGIRASYRFDKISDAVDTKIKEFGKEYFSILNKYSKKDESGAVIKVLNDEGKEIGVEYDNKEEVDGVIKELLEKEFTIEVKKIEASDLQKISVSPKTLHHLLPFIDGLED